MCQIFKKKYPIENFIGFLNKITYKQQTNNNIYFIDNSNYKICTIKNVLNAFLKDIKSFYHISKQFYVERKLNYTNFITIIRQICKSHNIPMISKIKYEKSSYRMCYYLYLNNL